MTGEGEKKRKINEEDGREDRIDQLGRNACEEGRFNRNRFCGRMETDLPNDHALSMTVYGRLRLATRFRPLRKNENRNAEYAFVVHPLARVFPDRMDPFLLSILSTLSSRRELLSFINRYSCA